MKWQWRDGDHEVALHLNYLTGQKKLYVDGAQVPTKAQMLLSWSHPLTLGDKPAEVRLMLRYLLLPEATLTVDNAIIAPESGPRPVPRWAWAFVLANLAILIATLGGAIPGAFAGIGATAAMSLARSDLGLSARLAACTAVTLTAWVGTVLILRALG